MTGVELGRVAVLYGGTSAEREVSLNSGKAVHAALISKGVDAFLFDPKNENIATLLEQKTDRVFIALHGRGGEDGTMQGALEVLGLPYTGSKVMAAALAMDKVRCKQIWQAIGLPTAKYRVLNKQDTPFDLTDILESVGGEAMVKPAHEGSSVGMARVANTDELAAALSDAFNYDDHVLVEQFISGDEFTVAFLNDEVLPSIQMIPEQGAAFYDFDAKYVSGNTQYLCPSPISESEEAELAAITKQAYQAIGVQGWGRVDFMRDKQGNWYLLEVNTVPGMTATSLVPKAAAAAGINFEQLVVKIAEQAK